jgi:LPXTG-motif cell wall-anchored protein
MIHRYRTAILTLGAVLGLSATQAFAGLSLVGTGTSASWTMQWTVNSAGGIGNVSGPFTKIVATTAGAVTYTVTAGTFTVSNPSLFEDLGSGGVHRAWSGFSHSSWAQSVPTGSGAANVTTTTAVGNQVLGSGGLASLTFTLNFTGLEDMTSNSDGTNGAHYFLDFFNASGTLVSQYEIKDIINTSGIQGTEITQTVGAPTQTSAVPLPTSAWAGLAMLGGMGVFLVKRRRALRQFV